MKISTPITSLNQNKKVYNIKDFEIRDGKRVNLNLVITPLNFFDGKGFYLYKDEKRGIVLDGEGYIFENDEKGALKFANKEKKELLDVEKIIFSNQEGQNLTPFSIKKLFGESNEK